MLTRRGGRLAPPPRAALPFVVGKADGLSSVPAWTRWPGRIPAPRACWPHGGPSQTATRIAPSTRPCSTPPPSVTFYTGHSRFCHRPATASIPSFRCLPNWQSISRRQSNTYNDPRWLPYSRRGCGPASRVQQRPMGWRLGESRGRFSTETKPKNEKDAGEGGLPVEQQSLPKSRFKLTTDLKCGPCLLYLSVRVKPS